MILPDGISPADLASKYGWSERAVRSTARRLGACLIMGKTMTLLPKHVEKIMEAIQCPSDFTVAAGSGITAELLAHLIGFAEETVTRPAKYYGFAVDARFTQLAAEIRKADAMPAEGIRTTRAALVMVIVLEEFFAGDREATSHFLAQAGVTLPWLRGEAWQARRNEKEARVN